MTFLCGVAKSFIALAFFRALAGVAAAMLQPATWGYLGDYFEYQRRGTATAWVMQAGSVAVVLGVPLGGLVALYVDWHGIFIAASLLAVLIAVLVLLLLPSLQTGTSKRGKPKVGFLITSTLSTFSKLISNVPIRASLAVSFLIWFGFQGQYTYIGAYLDHTFGLDSARIGFITLTLGVGYILGGQLGGRLSDRFGRKWIILIGLTFLAMVLGILPSVQQLPIAIFGIFAIGFGFFFTYSAQVTLMTELLPEARSTAMSANYFFTYIGLMAGSAVGGLILAKFDFPKLGYMSAVACVLAGVIAYRYVFTKTSMIV
jgi:predicted MFS family arabinose efflux permease